MKQWYNEKARFCTFQPGDQVLVLLPVHGQPLQAHYCGPYTIERKVNEVDYIVKTPGRQKERRMCHVNMLKLYHGREAFDLSGVVALSCIAKNSEQDITIDDCKEIGRSPRLKNFDVLMNLEQKLSHLPIQEKEMLKEFLWEFTVLFPDVPGKTTLQSMMLMWVIHCLHPYRVNPVKLKLMKSKIDYMLKNGIIEPSKSPWSSPCVLVQKADGTFRFCIDFWKINGIYKTDSYPIP